MQFATFILALSALAFAGVAHAEGEFVGTVLRVDEDTYRINFTASYHTILYSGCPGDPPEWLPEGTTAWCQFISIFRLNGEFGIPRNSNCGEPSVGQLWCGVPHSWHSDQFDFEASSAPSRLTLEWSISGDYGCEWCWPEACQGVHQLCGSGYAGGVVYADLPIRVGDSASFQPTAAVESTPWGAVKQLYR
jgi:hypothetical protein